jgi:hypothetical protein
MSKAPPSVAQRAGQTQLRAVTGDHGHIQYRLVHESGEPWRLPFDPAPNTPEASKMHVPWRSPSYQVLTNFDRGVNSKCQC